MRMPLEASRKIAVLTISDVTTKLHIGQVENQVDYALGKRHALGVPTSTSLVEIGPVELVSKLVTIAQSLELSKQ